MASEQPPAALDRNVTEHQEPTNNYQWLHLLLIQPLRTWHASGQRGRHVLESNHAFLLMISKDWRMDWRCRLEETSWSDSFCCFFGCLFIFFIQEKRKKKKKSNTQVFNKYFICLAHVSISLFHRADEQENNWDCKYFEVQRGKLMPTQMYKETCNIRSNLQEYILKEFI